MLDFSDQPYQYFPARRGAIVAWALSVMSRVHRMPGVLKVDRVDTSGIDEVRRRVRSHGRRRDRLLFLPNHPTHADAEVFTEALHQAGFTSQMMAAYDVFLRSRLDAWVMQRIGAFSVDREGSDQRAMKEAAEVLTRGRHALTIFPEGNVYLCNDRVTPFNDGAAFLAIRAAKELAKHDVRVLAVPVSIKLTHLTDCRRQLVELMATLAPAMGAPCTPADSTASPRDLIVCIGSAAIRRNLSQRGLTAPDTDDIAELISFSAGAVLADLESKLGLEAKTPANLIDRVRAARRVIHEVRTDETRAADHAAALTWADQAMLAFRIASYLPDYIAEKPTLDRISETVEKIAEDVYGKMIEPIGMRRALVHFNEPVPIDAYIGSGKRGRQAIRDLTADCEASVQAGLDQLTDRNTLIGGQCWSDLS